MNHGAQVITIGEFDPAGQTGVVLERSTLNGLGLDPLMLVSSIKLAEGEIASIPGATLESQLRRFALPGKGRNIKIGQLAKRENIETVSSFFEDQDLADANFIVDVSLDAGENKPFLTSGAISLVRMRLLPLATMAIAYLSEAARLSGTEVDTISQMKEAAEAIHIYGPRGVLVRADRPVEDEWIDIYFDGKEHQFLFMKEARPMDIRAGRDVFAAVVVAFVAQGRGPVEAIKLAQKFESRQLAADQGKLA